MKRCRTVRLFVTLRNRGNELTYDTLAFHAEHRFRHAAHADVGDKAAPAGKNAPVCGLYVRMCAEGDIDSAVEILGKRRLFACRLRMDVADCDVISAGLLGKQIREKV